jgi:transposase
VQGPVEAAVESLADLCGAAVSVGFVTDALARTKVAVAGANKVIADKIADYTGAAFFDESATKLAGKEHWFHVAATDLLTAYHADKHSRKIASMVAAGILPVFRGVAVHDALTGYFNDTVTPQAVAHQPCWAHLDRALKALTLFDESAKDDGWARDLRDLMSDIQRWRQAALDEGTTRLPQHKHDEATDRWDRIVAHADRLHPHLEDLDGGQSDARRLVARLIKRRATWLYFLNDLTVEPWNNVAERAVRMIKTKTKVSGGFTTLTGLQTFLAVRGYLDTLRKHALGLLDNLIDALNGHA